MCVYLQLRKPAHGVTALVHASDRVSARGRGEDADRNGGGDGGGAEGAQRHEGGRGEEKTAE